MHHNLAKKYGFKYSAFMIDALRQKGAESNVSLMARLCFKHKIPACMFYNEYMNDGSSVNHEFFNYEIASHFNSYTNKTLELEKKFQSLTTGRRDEYHSYSFLHGILDPQARGFISQQRRWCPSCYRERMWSAKGKRGLIFDDLYWSVDAIKICMLHGEHLEGKCYQCKSRQPYLSTSVEPGYCHFCASFLGDAVSSSVDHETLSAQQLLFHLFYVSTYDDFRPEMSRFTDNLKALSGDSITGFSSELGELMGVAEDVVRKWISGARKPQLGTLFELQKALGLSGVHQLFLDEHSFIERVVLSKTLSFNFNSRSKLKDFQKEQEIKDYLHSILSGKEQTLSRESLSKKFGISEGGLMSKFGSLMGEVSKMHISRLQLEKEARDQDVRILIDRALAQVIARRKKWSVANVLKEVSDEKMYLLEGLSPGDLTMYLMKAKQRRANGKAYSLED